MITFMCPVSVGMYWWHFAAEPVGKSEEGVAHDHHTDVPQQSPQLGAGAAGCMALCIAVAECAWPGAACNGRVVHAWWATRPGATRAHPWCRPGSQGMIIAQLMFNQQQRFGLKPGVSNTRRAACGPRNYFVRPAAMSANLKIFWIKTTCIIHFTSYSS